VGLGDFVINYFIIYYNIILLLCCFNLSYITPLHYSTLILSKLVSNPFIVLKGMFLL
jgi:hypothetical protein